MIIGITGTLGAGKGVIAAHLVNHYGAKHFSARTLLANELERQGKENNRDTMVELANSWREEHGPEYIAKQLILAAKEVPLAVVESLRALAEVDFLKKQGGVLFAVNAPVELRYKHVQERKSVTDRVSFDKFVADEKREAMQLDPTKGNLYGCIKQANHLFTNAGSLEELKEKVDEVMHQLI